MLGIVTSLPPSAVALEAGLQALHVRKLLWTDQRQVGIGHIITGHVTPRNMSLYHRLCDTLQHVITLQAK